MDIKWYGHGCFRLKDRAGIAFTDPFSLQGAGYNRPKSKADIITVGQRTASREANLDGFTGEPYFIQRPGEYEVSTIFVTAIPTLGPNKQMGSSPHTLMLFQFDDISICHLGQLDHVLNQDEVERLSEVDILLVPVGGHAVLTAAQAAEVISLVEPYIVIPMYYDAGGLAPSYDPVDKFLKEMGATSPSTVDELKITRSGLPDDTQIVLLNP